MTPQTYVLFTIDVETNWSIGNGFWSWCVNGHLPTDLEALMAANVARQDERGYWLARDWIARVAEVRRERDAPPYRQTRAGRIEQARAGLPLLLGPLERHGWPAVGYVDLDGLYRWGAAEFAETIELLAGGGHDIQLHIHMGGLKPDLIGGPSLPRVSRLDVIDWPPQIVDAYIDRAVADFTRAIGIAPVAHRAGGYRCSDAIIDALTRNGIRLDSSYDHYFTAHHSICRGVDVGNNPFRYRGLVELPVTAFRERGQLGRLTALTGPDPAVLDALSDGGVRVISFLFHAYELMRQDRDDGGRRWWAGRDGDLVTWFDHIVEHVASRPQFEVVDTHGLLRKLDEEPDLLQGGGPIVEFGAARPNG